ncbi:MAG: hypothetical protein FJ279_36850 [Planctomycetes bacterium]|nr:hypothetical protein [Planctomycetota bacterium]
MPFEVTGKALVLSAKRPKAWQIPVGGRVAALHFLHCTTRPPKVIDHLYDRNNEMPKLVGRYTVHYEDGSRESLRLTYRGNITDWNSKLGAGECDVAWQGQRPDGALVTLAAWEWLNPQPDKRIAAIDAVRSSDQVNLVLLAVTAKE